MFSETLALLRKELSAASNIKDRRNRQSVQGTLKSLIGHLTNRVTVIPGNGLCLFWGPKTSDRSEVIPPHPLAKSDYICGPKFYTVPLEELSSVEKPNPTAIIVVDGKSVLIGQFHSRFQKPKILLDWTTNESFKKHKKGGQSAQRFGRLADEHRASYYKRLNEKIERCLRQFQIERVLLAGPGDTKLEVTISAARVVDRLTVASGGIDGLLAAKEELGRLDTQYQHEHDRALLDEFYVALNDSRVAFGSAEIATNEEMKNVKRYMNISNGSEIGARFWREFGECAILFTPLELSV